MTDNSETIRSRQNALLKRVRAVANGKERGTLLLEGERLVLDAVGAGVPLEVALVAEGREVPAALERQPVRRVERDLLQGLGSLRTEPDLVALAAPPAAVDLASLEPGTNGLLLVVDGVADPGNLGALARAAEAAGACGMVVLLGGVGPWNPRALRGSMGSLLRLPVVREPRGRRGPRGPDLAGVALGDGCDAGRPPWREADWSGPVALWVSGETGLEPEALANLERADPHGRWRGVPERDGRRVAAALRGRRTGA